MGLLLTGGSVVTSLDPPTLVKADVAIEGDRVSAVGTGLPGIPRRDCEGSLIVPGNVCAHTHLYSALARGMPYELEPPADFLQILQRIWWRLDRALDEESIRAMQARGLVELPVTADIEQAWRKEAEQAWPQIRGTMVPAETFDKVRTILVEYRGAKQ